MASPRVSVVLPTWNGEEDLERLLPALARQELAGGFEVRAVDSGSTDRTRELLLKAGAQVQVIAKEAFRHGATRNLAAKDAQGELLVFLSQDATPRDASFLAALAGALDDPTVGGAYARVLPREGDDPLTARTVLDAREASEVGETREFESAKSFLLLDPAEKARLCAFNDVASCIRKSVLQKIPFPDVEFGEDVAWASRALEAKWKIRYEPRAVVHHAHRYTRAAAYERYRIDAKFLRETFGWRVRPSAWSVARGIAYEVMRDAGYILRHGGFTHLLRSPFLRTAQVLGQREGSRPSRS